MLPKINESIKSKFTTLEIRNSSHYHLLHYPRPPSITFFPISIDRLGWGLVRRFRLGLGWIWSPHTRMHGDEDKVGVVVLSGGTSMCFGNCILHVLLWNNCKSGWWMLINKKSFYHLGMKEISLCLSVEVSPVTVTIGFVP